MKRPFLMPKLGLTMTEGAVSEWPVAPGSRFVQDQTVFVVETEKAANDVGAEADGVMLDIVHGTGTVVSVGEVIGYWDDGVPGAEALLLAVQPAPVAPAGRAATEPDASTAGRVVATPLARAQAALQELDLCTIRGSGPGGRIKAADVAAARGAPPQPAQEARGLGATRVEPGKIALATARRLLQAKREIPHFYLAVEADVGQLRATRAEVNEASGSHFTLNHFIVAAVGRALEDEPAANRVWQDEAFLQLEESDVGLAVNTDHGLYVPVVRNAGARALAEVARDAQLVVERARAASLGAEDMGGGAITISNAGMFDVTYITPIINPGQAMILGVGSVREVFRPDAQRRPVLREEMGLVLACDHRVLDGVSGLRFLRRVVHHLEEPTGLLALP